MNKFRVKLFSRRVFLHSLPSIGLLSSTKANTEKTSQHTFNRYENTIVSDSINALQPENSKQLVENNISLQSIYPKPLKKGSTIGITAPASSVSKSDISDAIQLFTKLGCNVVLGKTIGKHSGYLSASDEMRAADLMEMVERKDIDAILCARGGYGVMRILPYLDFTRIAENPKIICGYSDITALITSIYKKTGIITFHGPVASSTFEPFTKENFLEIFWSDFIAKRQSKNISYSITEKDAIILNPGKAKGRLIGGNLSLLVGTLGTPYEVDTRNAILFIEEVTEEPYRIDRMLTQLWLAGKLQQCSAILLGRFKNCEALSNSPVKPSFSLMEVLKARISTLGVPAVYGFPFGHVKSKLTLPIGIEAELDASSRILTLLHEPIL